MVTKGRIEGDERTEGKMKDKVHSSARKAGGISGYWRSRKGVCGDDAGGSRLGIRWGNKKCRS